MGEGLTCQVSLNFVCQYRWKSEGSRIPWLRPWQTQQNIYIMQLSFIFIRSPLGLLVYESHKKNINIQETLFVSDFHATLKKYYNNKCNNKTIIKKKSKVKVNELYEEEKKSAK
ncbi:hypothetical protein ACKWTF_010878 [Chironomus riparius]